MAVKAISRDGVNQIKKILLLIMRKSVNYKYRMHDPRIGRFFVIDPLASDYPWNSSYAFIENIVIDGVELEDLEWKSVKNEDGQYFSSEWDPDNSRDAFGNLKEGYFSQAILFSDNMRYGGNSETDKNGKTRISSFNCGVSRVQVFKADGSIEEFDGTTLPSDPEKFGTADEGLYAAVKHWNGKKATGYWALQVRTLKGNSAFIPAKGTNPAGGGNDGSDQTVDGVKIHKAGKSSFTGTFWKKNRYSGVSEGCQLIKTDQWKSFYSCFDVNLTIGVIINRTEKTTLLEEFTVTAPTCEDTPENNQENNQE